MGRYFTYPTWTELYHGSRSLLHSAKAKHNWLSRTRLIYWAYLSLWKCNSLIVKLFNTEIFTCALTESACTQNIQNYDRPGCRQLIALTADRFPTVSRQHGRRNTFPEQAAFLINSGPAFNTLQQRFQPNWRRLYTSSPIMDEFKSGGVVHVRQKEHDSWLHAPLLSQSFQHVRQSCLLEQRVLP